MSDDSSLDALIPAWLKGRELEGGAANVMLCHVHCLPSMLAFFEWFANRSIFKGRIAVVPKPYSTIPFVVQRLKSMGIFVVERPVELIVGRYDECCEGLLRDGIRHVTEWVSNLEGFPPGSRVVLVDDGGLLTEAWQRHVINVESSRQISAVSVQQTSSGMRAEFIDRSRGIAKVDMARSYAKRHFEASVIAEGIVRKVESMGLLSRQTRIGIVGVGALGRKLVLTLAKRGFKVCMYDRAGIVGELPGARTSTSYRHCIDQSDVVFGCVGGCWMDEESMSSAVAEFVSCSSRDVEYLSLLRSRRTRVDSTDWFSCAETDDGAGWRIYNWGFPINFDRVCEWEDPLGISLTRALLAVSVLLALRINANDTREIVPLPLSVQHEIVSRWLALKEARCSIRYD